MQGPDPASERQQGTSVAGKPAGSDRQDFILTPADFRKILIKRQFIILACLATGLILGAVITFFTTPVFESTARIDINPDRSTNLGISDLLNSKAGGNDESTRLLTEARILQSDSVIFAVIESENLFAKKPFSKVFEKQPYVLGKPLTPAQRIPLIRLLRSNLQVVVIPNTDLVEIHYRDPDPNQASRIAQAVVDQYLELDLRSRYEGTLRISNWLSGQLTELKAHAADAQRKIAQFQRANNLIGMDAEGGNLVSDSLRLVNEQLIQAEADRIVKEARYHLAETRNPELLVSVAPTTTLVSLRTQQAELLVQSAELKSKYGFDYPRVREVEKQLTAVQTDIDAEISNLLKRFEEEYNAAVNTEALLKGRLEQVKQEAFRVSDSSADFEILKHEAQSTTDLYDALQMKLKEASVTAGLNSNNVNLVDKAEVPAFAVAPKKRTNYGFGALIGLFIGIAAALFLETLDDTIRTSEDAEAISSLPSLAVVPRFTTAAKEARSTYGQQAKPITPADSQFPSDLVSYLTPQTVGAEAFRTLRSSILLSSADNEARLILITSSLEAEGKSTIAANLAISFARRDARVLLVDTDLRRGTLHLKFRLPNREGLSTLLVRESGSSAYQSPIDDLPNLFVLTRGPIAPNPGEILASRHMESLMEGWKTEYDHVILDSAPVLPVADSLSLAPGADSTIIVVRAAITRKKALLRVRSLLRRARARVTGIVVNDVDLRLENYYTYSKQYGYDYATNYGGGYGETDAEK
ncbi:Tyrosine-protein kinase EpsD [Acidisarcina polymorpha]|uniref:Tyrosine-protein kinase EpsD n=1 Tax=Acidisarcina polymorpha TaxID=2211140 RepID=A0A2Z5G448_9BACT|nr:polysaccharide biosynthesis tyrosine autokinase [Acidisarcina polymorpha]AXC13435.1 Tyrosine-protein kinase EpsD [Acidisarcina polymorpha]